MFLTIRGSSAGQSVARSEGLYLIPPESDSRTEVSFCWRCLAVPCELCTSRNCSLRVFLLLLLQNHSKYAFFYFVNYAFKFCLAGFGVFPASLIWSLLYFVLCDRLPRSFSKASSFNPTKSIALRQAVYNCEIFRGHEDGIAKENRVCAGWVNRFLFPCVELSDNWAEVEHFLMYIRCLILNCNWNFRFSHSTFDLFSPC